MKVDSAVRAPVFVLWLRAQALPSVALLFGIVMAQMVATHPSACEHMVLTTVDHIRRYPQALHHGGSRSTQVMGRPLTVSAAAQNHRVIVAAPLERAPAFEARLSIPDLLGSLALLRVWRQESGRYV